MNSRFAQRDDKISGYESTDYLSQLEYNCVTLKNAIPEKGIAFYKTTFFAIGVQLCKAM